MNTKAIEALAASASAVAQLSAELRAQHELITKLRDEVASREASVKMVQLTVDQWRKNYDELREQGNTTRYELIAAKNELETIKRLNPDLSLPEETKF
jgi:predicted  nucleic acid-binding Zn-ribbon protein